MKTAEITRTSILTKTLKTGKTAEVFYLGMETFLRRGSRAYEVVIDGEPGGVVAGPHMAVVKGVLPNPTVIGYKTGLMQLTDEEAKVITAFRTPEEAQAEREKADAFSRNLPGLEELKAAYCKMSADQDRADDEMRHLMDWDNDGARAPRPEDPKLREAYHALAAQYPRAALYLRASAQSNSGSWADNTGKAAAGKKAMGILTTGGTIEEVQAALAERRETDPYI